MELSKESRQRIAKAVEMRAKVESLGRRERHQFVQHYGWDEGMQRIQWIAEQPDTDRGTALLIYCMLDPVHSDDPLVKVVERNLRSGFYVNGAIAFDPASWSANGEDLSSLSAELLRPTQGEDGAAADLYASILRPPDAGEQAAIDAQVAKALAFMAKHEMDVSHDDPQRTASAIGVLLGRLREASPRPTARVTSPLVYLWKDCLRQVSGWHWAVLYDLDEERGNTLLLSPDRRDGVSGDTIARCIVSGSMPPSLTREMFHLLRQTGYQEKPLLTDYFGRGLVSSFGVPWVTNG